MIINIIFAIFAVLILVSASLKNIKLISVINILGIALVGTLFINVGMNVYKYGSVSFLNNLLYIDSLNLIQLFIIFSISIFAALYSYKYIITEVEEQVITLRRAKIFYVLFNLFVVSMMMVALSNNIIGMWMGLEATTIATAFLIGFNPNKLSLEAAWKYIIICSLGIGIGLVGVVLFVYSANSEATLEMLNWTYLINNFSTINKDIAKIAFTFIFIGIGTKAGIAPMHTWLPDGHSESPSPISAMMSGILLNLALYVIVRFYAIIKLVNGLANLKYLFIIFGSVSLIISAFSILKQNNYKRLLAFSSIENIGIMTLGFGFGSYIAIYGALLHSVIHAFGKSLLFLVSGNILSACKTKRMDNIYKLIKTMPLNAVFLMLGMLIIVGAPPFASFLSEYKIIIGGIENGYYISTVILAVCILLVFAGFLKPFVRMVFREREDETYSRMDSDKENIAPIICILILALFTSAFFGGYLNTVLDKAALIICG